MVSDGLTINLVVAMARNGVIGAGNRLPWRLPKDLAYFKAVTWGHPLLMGRKTFESIGRPLPGRESIVLTRNPDWHAEGVVTVSSLQQGISEATKRTDKGQLMVIGGEQIYRQFLPLADRLYVTQVLAEVEGDAYFPAVDWDNWQCVEAEFHQADDRNPYSYSFDVYWRKK